MKNAKKAFTLVEVLTVVIVVTIMFVLLVAYVDFAGDDAKFDAAEADYIAMNDAIVSAVYFHSIYEADGLTTDPATLAQQINTFLEEKYFFSVSGTKLVSAVTDPFGEPYVITIRTGANSSDTTWELEHAHESRDAVSIYKLETGTATRRLLLNGDPVSSPIHDANPDWLPPSGRPMEEYSWEEIIQIFDAGLGDKYFNIGDTKNILFDADLDGDGANDSVTMALVAMNHDDRADGLGKAGGTFLAVSSTISYHMHGTNSAAVSWNETDMRVWLRNVVMPAMPFVLQNHIADVTKVYDDHKTAGLNTVTDSLWLASACEIGINNSGISESGQGTLYEHFNTAGVDFNGSSSTPWWTRSGKHTASGRDHGYFVAAQENRHDIGSDTALYPTDTAYVAFGFCIGKMQTLDPVA